MRVHELLYMNQSWPNHSGHFFSQIYYIKWITAFMLSRYLMYRQRFPKSIHVFKLPPSHLYWDGTLVTIWYLSNIAMHPFPIAIKYMCSSLGVCLPCNWAWYPTHLPLTLHQHPQVFHTTPGESQVIREGREAKGNPLVVDKPDEGPLKP